jgi:hypothetical protein
VLIQLALIVFGLFGILAAIVDMGFVRLTQVQMQVAADSAAMEGLRARDSEPDDAGSIDGFASDCMRRLVARDFVQWTFDDDFDLSGDSRSFGAGPNIKFTDGVDNLSAYQFMSVPEDDPDPAFRGGRTYKPLLQLNQTANLTHGDMVSGSFDPVAAPAEDSAYVRPDFIVDNSPPTSGDSGIETCPDDASVSSLDPWTGAVSHLGPISDSAFLVRLRRTNVANELDDVPGVSSRGTGLPLLFGRGTLIQDNPDSDYQPRRDGITVRATAIANARPALRVGASLPSVRGVLPLLLTEDFFHGLTTPMSVSVDRTTGLVSDGDGEFAADILAMNTVGLSLPPASFPAAICMAGTTVHVFAGIYPTSGLVANRVVGFGDITLQWPSDCSPSSLSITITRTTVPIIADRNATTVLDTGLPLDVPPSDIGPLLDAVRMFAGQADPLAPATTPGVVLAPALVR